MARDARGFNGRQDFDVEAVDVVRGEVVVHFRDEVAIMRAVFVQPENRFAARGARAGDGEFHPIANRDILGLAHAPNITGLHFVAKQRVALGIQHVHGARARNFKSLVVRAVFLRFLGHEADVGHIAHRRHIERAVGFAKLNRLAVHARVTTIGNDRFGVGGLAIRPPHLAGSADHRGH